MTDQDTASHEAVIDEALGVIDDALARMMQRDLVSSGEVADLLLDVRTLLTDSNDSTASVGDPAVEIADIEPLTNDFA